MAYLGYQELDNLDYYAEQYPGSDQMPVHDLSGSDAQ